MNNDNGISAFPDGENIFHWTGIITGANGTVKFFFLYITKKKGL